MFQSFKFFCLLLTAGFIAVEPLEAASLTWTNTTGNQKFADAGNWSGGTLSAGDNLTIGKYSAGTYPIIDGTALPAYFGSITIGVNTGFSNPGNLEQNANTLEARNQVQIGSTQTGAMLMTGSAVFNHTTTGNFYVSRGTLTLGRTGNATDNPTLNNTAGIFWLGNSTALQGTVNAYSGSVNNATDVIVGYNSSGSGTVTGNLNLYERGAFHHDSGNGNFTLGYGANATGNITLGTDGATATTPALTNAMGCFYVGYGGGTGNLTAYAGSIATGGYDGIGTSGAVSGNLNLYGNSAFNHQSASLTFAIGQYSSAGTLALGRDGNATDNASLNITGGTFAIGDSAGTGTVNAYSGAINAHGDVSAGANGGTANINLRGSAVFVHDTAGNFGLGNGTIVLGRQGNAADHPTLSNNAGELQIGNVSGATGVMNAYSSVVNNSGNVMVGLGGGAIGSLSLDDSAAFHHDAGEGSFYVGNGGTGIVTLGTDGVATATPALTNALGSFYVGYNSAGSGTVTAYSGTITTGGYDGIGTSGAASGILNLYGNAVFNHQSAASSFAVGQYGSTGTLTMGREGTATDNATLNVAGNFIVGESGSAGVVNAYSGTINAHNAVAAGTNGSTGNINLYGSAVFAHDTAGDFSISNGTLTLGGIGVPADHPALNLSAGSLQVANNGGAVGAVVVNAGTIAAGGSGIVLGNGNGTNATVTVTSGGSVQFTGTAAFLSMGYGDATTEWKQEGGTTNLALQPVFLGCHSASGGYSTNALRLNGGVFSASRIAPHLLCTPDELANIVSKIYFNGGTLQATFDSHLTSGNLIDRSGLVHFNACVQSRGALIDSNGHNVTIDIPLEADPASPGGGLMKIGAGALTLTEAPSYTGDTVVNVGELKALAGINVPSAKIYVATGAKLTATSITADKLTIGGAPVPPPTAAAATVPEPGMMALVLAAVLILAVAGFAGVCLRRK